VPQTIVFSRKNSRVTIHFGVQFRLISKFQVLSPTLNVPFIFCADQTDHSEGLSGHWSMNKSRQNTAISYGALGNMSLT